MSFINQWADGVKPNGVDIENIKSLLSRKIVIWDESTDTYAYAGMLNAAYGLKRCLLLDNGTVNYYLNPADSTKKADGTAADITTGADGQVMTRLPKMYSAHQMYGSSHRWDVDAIESSDLTVHPAFLKNGVEVDARYIGAFEGSMFDASTGAMVAPANITTQMYAAGDKLCSLSGQYPKTNETRAAFRGMAASRGAGWRQQDQDLISAIQLLYLSEYNNFNSQTKIGMGRTELSAGTWAADSYIGQCGKSNSIGNGTASVGGNTNNAYMTYRGIENFFGNVWKFVDGININDHVPYVCNNDTQFGDDTATNYVSAGVTMGAGDGYIATLCASGRGFFPASVGGSSSTKVPDYYYQAAGWRVVALGGHAGEGAPAGAFFLGAVNASSGFDVAIGGRLAF